MRVAIVSMTPCVTTQDSRVFREALSLKNAGHSVSILGVVRKTPPVEDDEYTGIPIHRINMAQFQHRNRWMKAPLYLLGRMTMFDKWWPRVRVALYVLGFRDIDVSSLPVISLFTSLMVPIRNWMVILMMTSAAYPIMKRVKPDVIHAHDLPMLPLAYLCKVKMGSKFVYDSHELWVDRNTSHTFRAVWKLIEYILERWFVKHADAVITVSEPIAKLMTKRYGRTVSVIYNYPILPSKSCDLRTRLGIAKDRKVLLYLGLITANRGIERIIQLLPHLPEYDLVMLGYHIETEKYIDRVYKLVAGEHVGNQVYFMPAVPFDEVTSWAASADVGIHIPSVNFKSYEYSFPNKVLEYVAAGLPVVVRKRAVEMASFVVTHDIGLAVDVMDRVQLLGAIREVTDNPLYRESAARLSSQISWGYEAEKMLRIYEGLK